MASQAVSHEAMKVGHEAKLNMLRSETQLLLFLGSADGMTICTDNALQHIEPKCGASSRRQIAHMPGEECGMYNTVQESWEAATPQMTSLAQYYTYSNPTSDNQPAAWPTWLPTGRRPPWPGGSPSPLGWNLVPWGSRSTPSL